ncbi:MAG: ATP-binding protein [Lachnospiraceae bacterium]|nr:ATP-binding protein [Lachnospiraceae bacterium]
MAEFSIDLAGRVKNFDLPKNQPLIPLFEAIVNSIYAIEERQLEDSKNGYINIHIVREPQEVVGLDGINKEINEITGFTIVDNGVGLNDSNMKSFLQSDSTYRADKGGKGVGRFSWLKAFSKAEIESVYRDEIDNVWVKRKFDFSLNNLYIDDSLEGIDDVPDNKTCIKLIDYLPTYRKNVSKNAETIAMKIMQHCMIYLMSPKCPIITILDEEKYCINDMFEKIIQREKEAVKIQIGKEEFSLLNTMVQDASLGGSKLFLYANDRMVKPIDLDRQIVDLDKNIFHDKGFYYVGILSGKYLDNNVDMNRTSFDIPENKEEGEISIEDIVTFAKLQVEDYLSDYLSNVRETKNERIKKYIHTNAPQFSHLLKYMPDAINMIKPTLSDTKLDEELYKIKRKFDLELKQTNEEIIDKIDVGTENLDTYKDKFKEQFEKISEANKAALAEYVAHRKIILELLKKGILIKDDGKFNLESYVHNLIYPMRRTSDEIEFESHNLWLIDERLAYCEFISSDVPFDNNPKENRTDILMLDRPVAISDEANNGKEYETIVIFELKRPMRNDYNLADNPIEQLLGYVDKLSTNKVTDKNGRIIRVGNNTQFYLYAVCDLTSSLIKVAEHNDFKETPDRLGMYKYHDKKHAYIEILSFNKIINDAEKRNRILFDKLGI